MKDASEVEVELVKVRAHLARLREAGRDDETEILYGAQQALIWVLARGHAPSRLQEVIEEVAETLALS